MDKRKALLNYLKRHEFYLLAAILGLVVIISITNPSFLSVENLLDLFSIYSFMGILSVGVLIVLISGGIDISFTATATIAQYITALMIANGTGNIPLAFLVSALIGAVLGGVNALFIHFFKIPAIITTIATLNIYNGMLRVFSRGKWIYNLPGWFREFGQVQLFKQTGQSGAVYGVSVFIVIWLLLIALTWFILTKTILGRSIYALGGNPVASRRVGLPVFRLRLFVYGYMGFIAGIGAVVHALQVQTVAPNAIVGKELTVIAAVLVGGASLSGGRGSLLGTFLGVALMAIISNGLTLMKVPAAFNEVVIGAIIIASVGITSWQALQAKRYRATVKVDGEEGCA